MLEWHVLAVKKLYFGLLSKIPKYTDVFWSKLLYDASYYTVFLEEGMRSHHQNRRTERQVHTFVKIALPIICTLDQGTFYRSLVGDVVFFQFVQFNNFRGESRLLSRLKRYTTHDDTPVSYTHLTLPTTPYV